MISFSRSEISFWLPCPPPPPHRRPLGLGELALERVCLNEKHIRARFRPRILGGRVEADEVARNELEVFEIKGRRAVRFLCTFLFQQAGGLVGAAINGIMKRQIVEPEFVGRLGTETVTSSMGLAR